MTCGFGWRVTWVLLALAGCGFDSGGAGTDGTESTTTGGSTDPATTDPMTNPATTEPTSVSATTDPATTDPSTGSETTDPATTDPPTGSESTDPATTDTNPMTDSSETDPSQGSTGDDDSSYPACPDQQCPDDQICAPHPTMPNVTTCREPCNVPADCPVPSTGNAVILCPAPEYPYCVLDCDPAVCPDGQDCFETEFGSTCYWG